MPVCHKLEKICSYTFVFIDDLLPFVDYGIILTTAYGRGIASLGDRQLSTYFVFLNADFVLSNGTLRTVVDRIGRGYRAVMAPSLRGVEEVVEAELRKRVSKETGLLDATPAELVQLTLDHLHPTAAASVINKPVMHHTGANQFFWQVDDHTLIGRYFLLFMLCIRPEQPFVIPTGWCDYAFMPDLVPSHNFDVLTDSEEGFILEMQALSGDSHHVRIGRVSPEYYSPRLSFWATDNHRKYAARTVVFHSRSLPSNFDLVKAEADRFMSDLLGRLTSPAVNHLDHPFWVSAVRHHQQRLGMHAMPPEFIRELTVIPQHFETDRKRPGLERLLGRFGSSIGRASGAAVRKIKDRLIGRAPSVGILHYAYLDYKNFRHRIADFSKARGCVLYVKDHDSAFDAYIEKATSPIGMTIGALSEADSDSLQGHRPNGVIIRLSDENIHRLPEVLLSVGNFISDNDPVLLCTTGIQGAFFQARFTLAGDLAREVATRVKGNVTVREFLMVGHRERLSIDYRVRKSFQLLLAGGFSVRIAVALVVFSSFCKLLYINLTKQPHAFIREDDVCTSATVLLEARWRSIALAQSVSGTIVRRES